MRPRRLPGARAHRLSARRPPAAPVVRRGADEELDEARRAHGTARRRSSAIPQSGRDLYNAAAVCAHGRVLGVYRKHLLPNYAVFDEQRYFAPSTVDGPLFVVAGVRVAVTICEDAWSPTGPIATQAAGGAELVVNINASPYYAGRVARARRRCSRRARPTRRCRSST